MSKIKPCGPVTSGKLARIGVFHRRRRSRSILHRDSQPLQITFKIYCLYAYLVIEIAGPTFQKMEQKQYRS